MAILTGFPPSNQIGCVRFIGPNDLPQYAEPEIHSKILPLKINSNRDLVATVPMCPKILQHLDKQNERVRAALVVYALDVMEDLGIESTPQTMQDCLDVGEEMYFSYKFEKHGAYGEYIRGHLKKLLQEGDYYSKVISRSFFG